MYSCPYCDKSFKFKSYLKRHIQNKFPCEKKDNIEHNEPVLNNYENKCKFCLKVFKEKEYLKRHKCKKEHCSIRENEIELGIDIIPHERICKYCEKEFSSKKSKYRHEKQFCVKKTEYEDDILSQIKEKHNKSQLNTNQELLKELQNIKLIQTSMIRTIQLQNHHTNFNLNI